MKWGARALPHFGFSAQANHFGQRQKKKPTGFNVYISNAKQTNKKTEARQNLMDYLCRWVLILSPPPAPAATAAPLPAHPSPALIPYTAVKFLLPGMQTPLVNANK